ncbi:hypothetical protein ACHQM5_030643 [Ranunculus cassubicifolius]
MVEVTSFGSCNKMYVYRCQLEQDVERLQEELLKEVELHTVLEDVVQHTDVALSSLSHLPHNVKELLSTIFSLEVTVSNLDEQILSLHLQLDNERNERRLVEYHVRCAHSKSPEDTQHLNTTLPGSIIKGERDLVENNLHVEEIVTVTTDMPIKDLSDYPNQLSEEMVHCMRNIFTTLANSSNMSSKPYSLDMHSPPLSPRGHHCSPSLLSSSDWSSVSSIGQSQHFDSKSVHSVLATEIASDPYKVRGKLSWADIGNYRSADEISWMSVGKKQLEYAAGALRRYRFLVEQLAKVNPMHLSCNEKLAFWINIYNALIMHGYLAYGVPRNELKSFSLMQKAAYTIGGHFFSAVAIEYGILKMKPPSYRPQTALLLALHKLKVPEEQHKFSIDSVEPIVAFALSCGMYSSPAVKVYTAMNVKNELLDAQRDFIRASVGVTRKGRLLVPKMIHCFARGFIDDSSLAVWICRYLTPNQASFVENCMLQRRQRLHGSHNCGILPFSSQFRYLFLPDNFSS